jgi:aryl-alcohol dehydrogenase-like predicted oxidoreductase
MAAAKIRRRMMPGTDLDLSVICLGGVPLGGGISEDESFRLLDAFVALGGNFVDTAAVYSDWLGPERGSSERRIGKWLRSRGLQDQVTVATKGGHPRMETLDRMRLTPEELRDDIELSRERLGLATMPLYYLHRDDPARPVEELMDVLGEAVAARKIRYLGCSNWRAPRIRAAQAYTARRGLPSFVVDQPRWSLARINPASQTIPGIIEMDTELYAYHQETAMAAVPYSSQAQGFFSGGYGRAVDRPQARGGEKIKSYYYNDENFARLERVEVLARRLGRPATHVALAWLLGQPFAVYPIIGVSSVAHLEDSVAAHDLELSAADVRWLETGSAG